MEQRRRLPNDLDTFERMVTRKTIFVDKTDLVYKLANGDTLNYLSRPRRFGKSVLVDTLECYFLAKKQLFEGLKLMRLETEWKKYVVLRLSLNLAGETQGEVTKFFPARFKLWEEQYNIPPGAELSYGDRFERILNSLADNPPEGVTGEGVVILIDEFDYPLSHSYRGPEHEPIAEIYRSVFSALKAAGKALRFVFITGISRFTHVSLFSVQNNLSNLSFNPDYDALCGITQAELEEYYMPEVRKLAAERGCSEAEMLDSLKARYDGYHFSCRQGRMLDVYNSYCLVSELAGAEEQSDWSATGATKLLPDILRGFGGNYEDFEGVRVDKKTLWSSDVTGGPELFLYQSGYLTIKGEEGDCYVLGYPNGEVRQAMHTVLGSLMLHREYEFVASQQRCLRDRLERGLVASAMDSLKALLYDTSYSEQDKRAMLFEERYRLIFKTILRYIGCEVDIERRTSKGRIDIVIRTLRYVYVIELKLAGNGGLRSAVRQLRQKKYAEALKGDVRTVVAIAIELDDYGEGITDWKQVEPKELL